MSVYGSAAALVLLLFWIISSTSVFKCSYLEEWVPFCARGCHDLFEPLGVLVPDNLWTFWKKDEVHWQVTGSFIPHLGMVLTYIIDCAWKTYWFMSCDGHCTNGASDVGLALICFSCGSSHWSSLICCVIFIGVDVLLGLKNPVWSKMSFICHFDVGNPCHPSELFYIPWIQWFRFMSDSCWRIPTSSDHV